jgi:glycosyltransferase involved in cell wall biosynthesis
VIAGMSGGTSETLDPGRTGELVPCETPDELARVVGEFLADPERRNRFGARGRQHVVERFDWSVLTHRAETLFGGPAATAQPERVSAGQA